MLAGSLVEGIASGASRRLSSAPMRRAPLSFLAALLAAMAARQVLHAEEGDEVRVTTLVRGDTDTTIVVNPSVRARVELFDPDTHVDAEYTADVWTSASIDIRTAATQAVTEQRDELNAGLDRRIDDFTLRGGYRYSSA